VKRIFTTIFFIAIVFSVYGQIKQGMAIMRGYSNDGISILTPTTDGGYAISGTTSSFGAGQNDLYLTKLDSLFNVQWARSVGGKLGDYGNSMTYCSDGGYALAGWTDSYGVITTIGGDVYAVKLSSTGNLLWTLTVGGIGNDGAACIIQTADGGFAITGWTSSYGTGSTAGWWMYNSYLVKTNAAGSVMWTKTYSGNSWSIGFDIKQTADHGYIMAGYSVVSPGDSDVYVSKLDSAGNVQWTTTIGGKGDDEGNSVCICSDGGYIVAGYSTSFGAGKSNVYVIKLDANGNVKWTETIGGTNNDNANCIKECSDKGYIIAGQTNSYGPGTYESYLVKIDSVGKIQWTSVYGKKGVDGAGWAMQSKDHGYLVAGYTDAYSTHGYQLYAAKLDSTGDFCQPYLTGGTITSYDSGRVGHLFTATSINQGTIDSGGIENTNNTPDTVLCFVPTPPKLTVISTNSCSGCNGTALATLTGANAGMYKYLWSNGDTTNYLTNLCPGKYVLYIAGYADTAYYDTITITALADPAVSIPATNIQNVSCYNDNNGSVTAVDSGGKPPYTYYWLPNGQTSATINNLAPGTYTVSTSDSNGCGAIATVTITQPAVLTLSVSPNITITAGANTALTATASGGTPPYSYQWSNNSSGSNINVAPTMATTYTVTVIDSNGCTAMAFVTIDIICAELYIPDAFSPNGDGHNDVFLVHDYCIKQMTLMIYDRWGNKMFESNDVNTGWDGTFKGEPMNTGTYIYYLQATLFDGTTINKKGNITLVR